MLAIKICHFVLIGRMAVFLCRPRTFHENKEPVYKAQSDESGP